MAKLSTLLDRIHDEFPSVPEALALRALSDAAKEFCTRTHVWRAPLPDVQVVEGQTQYDLTDAIYEVAFSRDIQLVALKDVRLNGTKLYPLATELHYLNHYRSGPGAPTGFVQWQPATIELINPPSEAGVLSLVAALTVKLGRTDMSVPDDLLDEYGEAIASGAKSRLVRQAGQPWFNPDLAVAYAGPYYSAITTAKGRVMTALGEAQMQVEMRRW